MKLLLTLLLVCAPAWADMTRNELLELMVQRGGSSTEYNLNIQRGKIDGISVIHKFGRNGDIDTVDGFEAIWDGGGSYPGFNATAAETIELFSSDADDATGGTGATAIELRGLGPGFVYQTEIVALNGTTPVLSTLAYLRMDRAIIVSAGSSGANEGMVTARQSTTTANVFAEIQPGYNRTLNAVYTVPAGQTAYVFSGFASMAKKQVAASEVRARVRFPGSVFQIVENFALNSNGSGYVVREFLIPLIGVPAGSDIFIEADTDANDSGISAGFEIVLVADGAP